MAKSSGIVLTAFVALAGAAGAFAFWDQVKPLVGMRGQPGATTVALTASATAAPTPADVEGRTTIGNLVIEGIPEIPEELKARILRYQNARTATFQDWTPTGGVLIATRFAETTQIHRVDKPLGMRRQLTFYAEPVAGADYPAQPDASGFIFARDKGGDENFQIYFHDDASGEDRPITEADTRNTDPVWSYDGRRVAWAQQTKASAVYKIVVADIADPDGRRVVFEREGSWSPVDWSADGTKLLLGEFVSVSEARLYTLDVASGELVEINPTEQKISYTGARFAPDGASIIAISDEGAEFQTLARYTLAGNSRTALSADISWDIEEFDISPDGTLIAFIANEGGSSRIHVRRLGDNREELSPELPAGVIGGIQFGPDSRQIGFTYSAAQSPGDIYSIDLATEALTRWTESEVGGLDPATFVAPSLIAFPTFDTIDGNPRVIPAYFYKPAGAGPFPVVITIHGGPESQVRPNFGAIVQFWVKELGIAVIAPNVRGSTGYGKSYVELDNGMKREDSVRDIGALLDWIATQSDLDASRVMVYGGSYGGYMVNAAMTHFGDRLAGGVSVVGISNFVTFLENTSGYRRDLRRAEYGDERDPAMRAFLQRISPLSNVAKIVKPFFIIQGANDPRVPLTESEQLVAALRANGGQPWYLLAMDEGHGFRKKSNIDYMNAAVALFFMRRLLPSDVTE